MLALVRWLSRRPLAFGQACGRLLGWLAWAASPTYRRRLAEHAALAGLAASERRAAIGEAGRLVGELPWLWLGAAPEAVAARVRWDGAELVEAALAEARGLVLLTPHLGCFEICAQAYAQRFGRVAPVTVLYRPARQAWLRELEATARAREHLATAPASLAGVRQMIRALRRGESVGLLPDQVPPAGMGVWAPFYGREAYTMTLAPRLVLQTGAAWLLMWGERLADGAGWVLHVRAPGAPLPAQAPSDEALQRAGATRINEEMQRLIAERPAQYLWGYHRYKAPREGSA